MRDTAIILIVCGVICLAISGYMMYRMIPREGHVTSPWLQNYFGETGIAMTQFTLMIAGLALIAKGLLL